MKKKKISVPVSNCSAHLFWTIVTLNSARQQNSEAQYLKMILKRVIVNRDCVTSVVFREAILLSR